MALTVFQKPGNWYKGNLHTHSTNSDGLYPPELVALWYWTTGYDFLSITDHRTLTLFESPPTRSPVLIPGMESMAMMPAPEEDTISLVSV